MEMPDANGRYEPHHPAQREPRERKLIRVEIERDSGPPIAAIITNISEQGMGGRTDSSLLPYETIAVVKKGYGRIAGEVRWVEGDRFGVLFAEAVNIDMFNFADKNKEQQHFVQPLPPGYVPKSFAATARRPGLTSQYSRR